MAAAAAALIDSLIGAVRAGELDDLLARLKPVGTPKARRADAAPCSTHHVEQRENQARPPAGTTGRAAVLTPSQVRHAFRVARTTGPARRSGRGRAHDFNRPGSAGEGASRLKWADLYDAWEPSCT
jgi:hypothetical protein